jgi:hypothetical protein
MELPNIGTTADPEWYFNQKLPDKGEVSKETLRSYFALIYRIPFALDRNRTKVKW